MGNRGTEVCIIDVWELLSDLDSQQLIACLRMLTYYHLTDPGFLYNILFHSVRRQAQVIKVPLGSHGLRLIDLP